jgi:hypothetical protein
VAVLHGTGVKTWHTVHWTYISGVLKSELS